MAGDDAAAASLPRRFPDRGRPATFSGSGLSGRVRRLCLADTRLSHLQALEWRRFSIYDPRNEAGRAIGPVAEMAASGTVSTPDPDRP
ncbi:hypothetical protein [Rhodovulum sp. YEN HP10]|uniref:hypothetical protein n=1 Tax=Rhodovulum sp. HP10 TaxID=3387397 RepID=UPI0039E0689C